jgi:glucose/arabinose dehydrogenase
MRRIWLVLVVVVAFAAAAVTYGLASRAGDAATPLLAPVASVATPAAPASAPPAVSLQRLAGSFDYPVYVTAPPGDRSRLFVVEKTGRIRIVKNGAVLARPFLDLSKSVTSDGERGLLSMAFDPGYAVNRLFYVDYTDLNGDTRVVRVRASTANPGIAVAASAVVVLALSQPYSNHNGGQLQFGPDGRLYVGMGDGGSGGDPQNRAQDPHSLLGKMLRVSHPASRPSVQIYASGVRNPWRFSFDRITGALWIGDVGQDKWEEIDFLRPQRSPGANLGWSGYEGTHVYDPARAAKVDRAALVWPVAQYSHAYGEAVVGGYVYRGRAIPALQGWYLFADYASGRVWAMKRPHGAAVPLRGADKVLAGITSFGQDAVGELYLASPDGSVYLIAPAG